MKVFVCTDLEGVCGVFRWEQTDYGNPANMEARHLLMGEVNAAIAGACDAGATRVVVQDGHGGARSFLPEDLDERGRMAMGQVGNFDRLLEEGFDCAFLVGYHSMNHTPNGVLCHTQSSETWDNFWINGRLAGEIAQEAIWLGSHGIPITLVTGDGKACAEATAWLGKDVVTVAVKEGLSREGALMLAPKRARQLIRAAAKEAVQKAATLKPYNVNFPLTLRFQFTNSEIVDSYRGIARRIDACTIEKEIVRGVEVFGP